MRRDLEQMVRKLEKQGWRAEQRRSGHQWLFSPDGVTRVSCPSTPSDYRGLRNLRAELRRKGAVL